MMYYYFVSGVMLADGHSQKYFSSEISMPDKISSFEEVLLLRNKFALRENIDPENVIIFNYQLLRIE